MKVIAFDTETKGLDWFNPDQQAFLVSWADASGSHHEVSLDGVMPDAFHAAIVKADVIVGHNLSFDIHQVRESWGFNVRSLGAELHDTDLMSRVVEYDEWTHGLKDCAVRLVDPNAKDAEDRIKELAKSIKVSLKTPGGYYEVWRAYSDAMEEYARDDARYTLAVYEELRPRLADKLADIYALEMRVAPILAEAERTGIAIDPDAVSRLTEEYEPREVALRTQVEFELGPGVLDGEGSRDALRDALLEHGVPLHRKTVKTGIIRTDKFALQEFEDDFQVIQDLTEWRRLKRFLDTYLLPMANARVTPGQVEGTLHTSFYQCEAWTGRMSSRRPNVQNLPKNAGSEVRQPIVPRPGHVFVVADYEGIEARLLAYYLGDAQYRNLFHEGHDPHAWMASKLHGGDPRDYEKGMPREADRGKAKNTMFAITYGAGAPRVADMNKITKDDAKVLIKDIKTALPGYHHLMRRVRKKIKAVGYVETLFGRKQSVRADKSYVGLNALIQGSAADIMKQGVINVQQALKVDEVQVLFVHDEIVVECPEDQAHACLDRVVAAMEGAAPGLDPPLAVDAKVVDTNYADA